MPGERQLAARCEDAHAIVRPRRRRPQQKDRLAQVRPAGERGHPVVRQPVGGDHHRQGIAFQGFAGEDVHLLEIEGRHDVRRDAAMRERISILASIEGGMPRI